MTDHNSPWQGRVVQDSSSNASSPLAPAGTGRATPSFERNVNRQKTQRWVQAKQYSYDGGDWGDEDDEDEDEPSAPPVPPYLAHRTASTPELGSGRLPGTGIGRDEARASPLIDARGQPLAAAEQKSLPFIRPVDIYKRMRDDRAHSSEDVGRSRSEEPPSLAQPNTNLVETSAISGTETQPPHDYSAPQQARPAPPVTLPEVKRMSGFGADFLNANEMGVSQTTGTPSADVSLHHNPSQASQDSQSSLGFTSVVHQAFDVPNTPESTTSSVVRSNSDGTSLISPIISHHASQSERTPTIHEEPAEYSTPTHDAPDGVNDALFFKPGHRRDMSLPDRADSPSRQPVIKDTQPHVAGQAEISSVDGQAQTSGSSSAPSSAAAGDFVAPLNLGNNGMTAGEGYRGGIPTIASISSEASPQDTDNDRLREEIMRSLSREGSHEPDAQPESAREGGDLASLGGYWNDTGRSDTNDMSKQTPSQTAPEWPSSQALAASQPLSSTPPSTAAEPTQGQPPRPKLGRRFSWESESSDEEPAGQPSVPDNTHSTSGPDLKAPQPEVHVDKAKGSPEVAHEASEEESHTTLRPRLSIVPPMPETFDSPQEVDVSATPQSFHRQMSVPVASAQIDESKLQGFRDILNKPSPADRVRAFNQTREQFAAIDTGLSAWLEFTVQAHPEHADLVQSSQSLSTGFSRSSPTTRKFPKLTSLSNLTTKEDGSSPGSGHVRRPSGHIGTIVSRQNVEQRGKDFLHTAGAFSGKAGEAAKGFFAKGRSKFRPSGDKVDT
ncbi:hypothetical protein N7539_009233 [Penicillium diatomitis]|uniref:Uncharacterized protein n=1 Tax=Penicillium diatomitis TaxID=2819901 RepID=A0A9W9WLE3_9EURO|nr:uncharacterized protein N7539_009233 [Penicillium diatomitis]KAJ5469615.1 hypothetical protein N7539_009233 [Penicillium diatomitis]